MESCVACRDAARDARVYARGLPGDFDSCARYSIMTCPNCGTGSTQPIPRAEELNRLYSGYGSRPSVPAVAGAADFLARWRQTWGKRSARVFYDTAGGRHRMQRRLLCAFFIPRVTLPPLYTDVLRDRVAGRRIRMLDVGCGSCEAMQFAAGAGVDVVGTEYGEEAAAKGWALGLDVRAVDIKDMVGMERFDIVRFSHVLEHVRDPEADLRAARALLGPGGYLMVAVPRFPSALTVLFGRHAWYHLPFHLYHFTPRGLRSLLERCGFRVLGSKSKSNSMLAQTVARICGQPEWANKPVLRVICIAIEMVWDACGVGDGVEMHAVASGGRA